MEADKRKRTEVYCNRCYACLKYTRGTSNLRYHLEKHHLTEYTQALSMEQASHENSCHSSVPSAKCSKVSKSSSEQTITNSFRKMTPLPRTSERYKKQYVTSFVKTSSHLIQLMMLGSGICNMFLNHATHPHIILQ